MPGNIDNIISNIPTIQQKAVSMQEIYAIVNKYYFVDWPCFAVLRIPWWHNVNVVAGGAFAITKSRVIPC